MTKVGPGTLKCVIIWPQPSSLTAPVQDELERRIDADNLRTAGPGAYLVHTAVEPAEIRDWLKAVLATGGSALVFEFEKWSGCGSAVDGDWLRARGH